MAGGVEELISVRGRSALGMILKHGRRVLRDDAVQRCAPL